MKNSFVFVTTCIFLMNCSKEYSKKDSWQIFTIDKNISRNRIFKQLNSEKEIQVMIDFEQPKTKKSIHM